MGVTGRRIFPAALTPNGHTTGGGPHATENPGQVLEAEMNRRKSRIPGYFDLCLEAPGPSMYGQTPMYWDKIAHFKLETPMPRLFPYINAVAESAEMFEKPRYVKFLLDGKLCGLHEDRGAVCPFPDRAGAHEFLDRLMVYLDSIDRRRDEIIPNFKVRRPMQVLEIYKILPGTNCGGCGFKACMAFAAALARREVFPQECPALGRPMAEKVVYPVRGRKDRILGTVSIEIDVERVRKALGEKQRQIESLERKLRNLSLGVDSAGTEPRDFIPEPLTGRESEVLQFMAQGATNMEISKSLGISPHTVKSHVIHIFNKLGVNDRTQAAVCAVRRRLI